MFPSEVVTCSARLVISSRCVGCAFASCLEHFVRYIIAQLSGHAVLAT